MWSSAAGITGDEANSPPEFASSRTWQVSHWGFLSCFQTHVSTRIHSKLSLHLWLDEVVAAENQREGGGSEKPELLYLIIQLLVVPLPAYCCWSDNVASPSLQVVGDDVTPTSLNEGRGEVVVPEPVVMSQLVVGGGRGRTSSSNMQQCPKP